ERLAFEERRVRRRPPPGRLDRPAAVRGDDQLGPGLVQPLPELPPRGGAAVAEIEVDGRGYGEDLRRAHFGGKCRRRRLRRRKGRRPDTGKGVPLAERGPDPGSRSKEADFARGRSTVETDAVDDVARGTPDVARLAAGRYRCGHSRATFCRLWRTLRRRAMRRGQYL